jgi:hypothetical protein
MPGTERPSFQSRNYGNHSRNRVLLGVLLAEATSWVRTLPGSQRLRALLVFDEVSHRHTAPITPLASPAQSNP